MISQQYLQSIHSMEHFKGWPNAHMRHLSSYAFSIKTRLTPFRTEILKLLKPNSLTPHNTIEGIEDAIMNLQDITIKYNIPKILSLTFCWPKAMKKQTNSQACPCLVYSIHDTPYKLRTIPATSIPPQKQYNDTFWFTCPVAK